MIENKRRKFQAKIERIRSRLSVNDKLITEDRKLILGYSIIDLVTKLREGDLDPVSVLEAYQVILHFLISIYLYITQKGQLATTNIFSFLQLGTSNYFHRNN